MNYEERGWLGQQLLARRPARAVLAANVAALVGGTVALAGAYDHGESLWPSAVYSLGDPATVVSTEGPKLRGAAIALLRACVVLAFLAFLAAAALSALRAARGGRAANHTKGACRRWAAQEFTWAAAGTALSILGVLLYVTQGSITRCYPAAAVHTEGDCFVLASSWNHPRTGTRSTGRATSAFTPLAGYPCCVTVLYGESDAFDPPRAFPTEARDGAGFVALCVQAFALGWLALGLAYPHVYDGEGGEGGGGGTTKAADLDERFADVATAAPEV